MILNDRVIREALLTKLENQPNKPKAIVQELRVVNGNAIADVVSLHNEAHCYEIKGATDKIDRIVEQGRYYNSSFRKITLVTTKNHLRKALELAPIYWGVMIVTENQGNILFSYARKALLNPDFDSKLALLTLWKSEMLNILDEKKHARSSREHLANLISSTKRKVELSNSICNLLIDRESSKTNFTNSNIQAL